MDPSHELDTLFLKVSLGQERATATAKRVGATVRVNITLGKEASTRKCRTRAA